MIRMKQLWAPWRMAYIEGTQVDSGCIFCTALNQADSPENLILFRGKNAFLILNRYPYSNGHMMVVPYDHVPTLQELDDDTLKELMTMAKRAVGALGAVYAAEAFNIGMNIGEAAGAGVSDHVHLHVVPRWPGDTNFMSSTAQTRVLPEDLEQTYSRLKAEWT